MKGFTFSYRGNDVFIVTDKTRRSKALIKAAFEKMGVEPTPTLVNVFYDYTRPARCVVKTLPVSGRQYYDIWGSGFGGLGYFLDEGKTIIVKI